MHTYVNKLIIILFVLSSVIGLASAQDETTFTWEPHPFTITPSEGWQVEDHTDSLLLLPATASDELAASPAIRIEVIMPARNPEANLVNYTAQMQIDVRNLSYGDATWPTATDLVVIGGVQSRMIIVAQTYLITATAPEEQWDAFLLDLEAMVASIEAQPAEIPVEQTLTQQITWRGISFDTPPVFLFSTAGAANFYLVITEENRLYRGRTFRAGGLTLEIRDLSPFRSGLSAESLADIRGFFYTDPQLGEITTEETDGLITISADILSTPLTGRAHLFLTEDDAYFIAAIADEEFWEAGDEALWEAIYETLVID